MTRGYRSYHNFIFTKLFFSVEFQRRGSASKKSRRHTTQGVRNQCKKCVKTMQEKLLQNFPWPVPTRVCRVWIGKNWPFSLIRLREKPVCDTVTEHYLKRLYKFSLLPKSSSPKPAAASAPHRHRYYTRIESSYAYSHSWEPQKRGELTGLFWEHMFVYHDTPKWLKVLPVTQVGA